MTGNMALIDKVLGRLERAGLQTRMITFDVPVGANRENNQRAGFSAPMRPSLRLTWDGIVKPRWLFGTFLKTMALHVVPYFANTHEDRGPSISGKQMERDWT